MRFGKQLDAALEDAIKPPKGKGKKPLTETQMTAKTQKVLALWLGEEAAPQRYRDPMARFTRE